LHKGIYKFTHMNIFQRFAGLFLNHRSIDKFDESMGLRKFLPFSNPSSDKSITLSAVWSAVRICSETIAMLPINVYKRNTDGRVMHDDSNIQYLLHNQPNNKINSFVFRQVMQAHVELWGNAYAIIKRDKNGQIEALEVVKHPLLVRPFEFDGDIFYQISGYDLPFASRDIIHIRGLSLDGIMGKSTLQVAAESINTGLAMQNYSYKIFESGSSKRIALKVPAKLSPENYERLKKQFSEKYSGIQNMHEIAILEAGMDFTTIGLNPIDAQFLEQRKFSVVEIARFFRIPPHKMQSMEASTNNNIEHQAIEFVTDTIMPRVAPWESELDNKLFSRGEKKYVKFNLNALLRGDMAARSQWYTQMINYGVMSPNEVRELEELNPREGGDAYLSPANLMTDKQRKKIEEGNALSE